MSAPIFQSKIGSVQVAVWEREGNKDGESFKSQSISITKPYKKDDKWINGTSYKLSDIPYIIMALLDVFAWKYKKEIPTVERTANSTPVNAPDAPNAGEDAPF